MKLWVITGEKKDAILQKWDMAGNQPYFCH